MDIGRTISSCINNQKPDEEPRRKYFEKRLASVSGLLLALGLFQTDQSFDCFTKECSNEEESCEDARIERKPIHSHCVSQLFNEFLHMLNHSDLQSDQRSPYKAMRDKGYLELRDALRLYQVELAAYRGEIIV